MRKLKAYFRGKHYASKSTSSYNQLLDIYQEATSKGASTIYIADGRSSEKIFSIDAINKRPIYFIRHDGVQTYTLPINPIHYPVTAIFADGSKEVVSIIS